MLKLNLESAEFFGSDNRFILVPQQVVTIEHSLSSVYDWESKWHKPFLSDKPKTNEEVLDYIDLMLVEGDLKGIPLHNLLTEVHVKTIDNYISDPMTATWFNQKDEKRGKEVVTAEVIYFWMTALNIPFECDKWHLNKLLTLIKVCSIKNAPPKKMTKGDIFSQNRALNDARRKRLGTKG